MLTLFQWLALKSKEYAKNIYLVDSNREISYEENFLQVKKLMYRLKSIAAGSYVVFIGSSSIESYQLSLAVTALPLIWAPMTFREDPKGISAKFIADVLHILNPVLIIYDGEAIPLIEKLNIENIKPQKLFDLFAHLAAEEMIESIEEKPIDRIISVYLTSGSTGFPNIVQHGWDGALQHAIYTIEHYGFSQTSRLFNPRQLFHVSGAFALITLIHCGGSIVIPDYHTTSNTNAIAVLMQKSAVTHASFFPSEMQDYAQLIQSTPELKPNSLQRITTGGEYVELSTLIKVSRAFVYSPFQYDCLWGLYQYWGDGFLFTFLELLYEQLYGRLVQVTQTYGATELICNAVANTAISGPDTRGVGSALACLHPEIIDENGMILPQNNKYIGRLRFFGSSIAYGYLNYDAKLLKKMPQQSSIDEPSALSKNCYQTNDLASIGPNGHITFFGRYENLIQLPGEKTKINPFIFEGALTKMNFVQAAIVFEHNNKLHAAIKTDSNQNQSAIISAIQANHNLALITSVSFWETFPLISPNGKTDRKAVIHKVKQDEIICTDITQHKPLAKPHNGFNFCSIF
jgi:acyl-coenzyme A synthetase/AMP-(fatty) acid ligase